MLDQSLVRAPTVVLDQENNLWNLHKVDLERRACVYVHQNNDGVVSCNSYMVETNFKIVNRPKPKSFIVRQGKYECAAAALAMILNVTLFEAKRAMGKVGWRNDDSGAGDKDIIGASGPKTCNSMEKWRNFRSKF